MRLKAFAVIDTNILVAAAISNGTPRTILELVEAGNIIPIFDERIIDEYFNVLHYPKLQKKYKITEDDIYDCMYTIVNNGILINDIEVAKEELKDKKDIPFFEVKESSGDLSSYLVTGNLKDFPQSASTVDARTMLGIMHYLENYIRDDLNYEQVVADLIEKQLATPKYTTGKELVDKIFDRELKRIKSSYFDRG